ncbi:MAG: hypothetical protein R3B96_06660 [Pirellulaceae bacterium]
MTNGLPAGDLGRIGLAISPTDSKLLYAMVPNANLVTDANSVGQGEPQEDGSIKLPFGVSIKFEESRAMITAIAQGSASGSGSRTQPTSLGQDWRSRDREPRGRDVSARRPPTG